MAQPISKDALKVLESGIRVDSAKREVYITKILSRVLYEEVTGVFKTFGAKYKGDFKKGTARHVFAVDPAPIIELALATGEANPHDYFSTPDVLGDYLTDCLSLATLPANAVILEPNYGSGALVKACIRKLFELNRTDVTFVGVELNKGLAGRAKESNLDNHLTIHHANFLQWSPPRRQQFDAVIMNPPFNSEEEADVYIAHIVHAWTMLKDHGRLAAVTPPGWTFRDREKQVSLPMFFEGVKLSAAQFRLFVETYGQSEALKAGLFKDVGTAIETYAVLLGKSKPESMPAAPETIAKPKPKPYVEPEYEDPRKILEEMRANEVEVIKATTQLYKMLNELFNPETDLNECHGCKVAVGEVDCFMDAKGRFWHMKCAQLALTQVEEMNLCHA